MKSPPLCVLPRKTGMTVLANVQIHSRWSLRKRYRTLKSLNAIKELNSNHAKCHGNRRHIATEQSKTEAGCLLGSFLFSWSPAALPQNYQVSLLVGWFVFNLTTISKKASFSNLNFIISYHFQNCSLASPGLFNRTYIILCSLLSDFLIPQLTTPSV